MSVFTEYGIRAQIPEAHDLLFTDNLEIQGNTIGGGGTPETPIAIQSVESPLNIKVTGKNIWNATDMWTQLKAADTTNINYVTFDGKDCISAYMPNAAARALRFNYGFKENTRYRIRLSMYYAGSAAGAYFQIKYTDGTKFDWYGQQTTNTPILNQWYYPTKAYNNYTTEANKTIDYLLLTFGEAVTTYFDLDSFLITEGTEEIPYEPYQGTTISIPIKDSYYGNEIPLHRIGTAYDSVYKLNGNWYLEQAIREKVLNGSENYWKIGNGSGEFYLQYIIPAKPAVDADTVPNFIATTYQTLSRNQFNAGNNGIYVSKMLFDDNTQIYIRDSENFAGFTLADFKTWLSTHNITVAYELPNHNSEELHADTITALDNLLALNSINRFSTNSPKVTITEAFNVSYGTSNRVNFKIPSKHNGKNVTRIQMDGFSGNDRLTYLYIPESIEAIDNNALNNNINLTDVYINRPASLGITNCIRTYYGDSIFYNCPKLTNIYVPADSIEEYKAANNLSEYASLIKPLP